MSRPIAVEVKALRDRNVDLIIARGEFAVPEEDVQSEVLFTEPFIVVAGAHSQWTRRRKLELAEPLDEKWILYPSEEAPGVLVDKPSTIADWRFPDRASPRCPITCETCC